MPTVDSREAGPRCGRRVYPTLRNTAKRQHRLQLVCNTGNAPPAASAERTRGGRSRVTLVCLPELRRWTAVFFSVRICFLPQTGRSCEKRSFEVFLWKRLQRGLGRAEWL